MPYRLALIVGLCVGMCLPAPVSAKELDPQGKPKNFEEGNVVSYYVWHEKGGWRVRTTTAKQEHLFEGEIIVEGGEFVTLENHASDAKRGDWGKISKNKKKITFGVKTNTHVDGFNFTVSKEATTLRYSLKIDGKPAGTKRINIGEKSKSPDDNDFNLPAHPQRD